MTISEELRAAATYLRQHGWCQGKPRDGDNRVCATEALYAVCKICKSDPYSAPDAFRCFLFDGPHGSIVYWNDTKGRTIEEVLAALEGAACIERMKEARLLPVITTPHIEETPA